MKLAVFTVRSALTLYRQFRDSHGVYIPVGRERRVCRRTGIETVIEYAALTGYCFLPEGNAESFQAGAPPWFNLRRYAEGGTLATVAMEDLIAMQKRLNAEFCGREEPQHPPEREWFLKGEKVRVVNMPLFEGLRGTVARCKSDGRVRILTENYKYIEISGCFLTKRGCEGQASGGIG